MYCVYTQTIMDYIMPLREKLLIVVLAVIWIAIPVVWLYFRYQ